MTIAQLQRRLSTLWLSLWDFVDLPGGVWLGILTGIMAYKLIYGPSITASEAALYSAAVGCYAATNIKGPRL